MAFYMQTKRETKIKILSSIASMMLNYSATLIETADSTNRYRCTLRGKKNLNHSYYSSYAIS